MVVRIPAGDITNLHYNFVVAKPLVRIKIQIHICKSGFIVANVENISFILGFAGGSAKWRQKFGGCCDEGRLQTLHDGRKLDLI